MVRKFLVIVTLQISLLFSSLTFATQDNLINWQSYSMTAIKNSSFQYVLIYFQSDWCHWCKQMNTNYNDPSLAQLIKKNFLPIKINVDKEQSIVRMYKVIELPTIIIINKNNQVMATLNGFIDKDQLITNLSTLLTNQH